MGLKIKAGCAIQESLGVGKFSGTGMCSFFVGATFDSAYGIKNGK